MKRDPVAVLPPEIVFKILDRCRLTPDLLRAMRVSRAWLTAVCAHPTYWESLTIRFDYPTGPTDYGESMVQFASSQLSRSPPQGHPVTIRIVVNGEYINPSGSRNVCEFLRTSVRSNIARLSKLVVRLTDTALDAAFDAIAAGATQLEEIEIETGNHFSESQESVMFERRQLPPSKPSTLKRICHKPPVTFLRRNMGARRELPRNLSSLAPNLRTLRLWYISIPEDIVFSTVQCLWAASCRGIELRILPTRFPNLQELYLVVREDVAASMERSADTNRWLSRLNSIGSDDSRMLQDILRRQGVVIPRVTRLLMRTGYHEGHPTFFDILQGWLAHYQGSEISFRVDPFPKELLANPFDASSRSYRMSFVPLTTPTASCGTRTSPMAFSYPLINTPTSGEVRVPVLEDLPPGISDRIVHLSVPSSLLHRVLLGLRPQSLTRLSIIEVQMPPLYTSTRGIDVNFNRSLQPAPLPNSVAPVSLPGIHQVHFVQERVDPYDMLVVEAKVLLALLKRAFILPTDGEVTLRFDGVRVKQVPDVTTLSFEQLAAVKPTRVKFTPFVQA
ncbi:hypothetical protein BKA62DRAFT_709928 [Auriculariales sp. MPI-PUGE-AT-0066]|nr:hypothetical protein BKA62DRAFT_709928 [Auriculariales sp. MPI-PUGE-AT-0066]